MIKINGIFKHYKNYFIGQMLTVGIAFIMTPILTRLLIPEQYGLLSIFNSMLIIFSTTMGLNISGTINRKYHEVEKNFHSFVKSNTFFIMLWCIFLCGLSFLFEKNIANLFGVSVKTFRFAGLVSFFNIFINMQLAYYQASQKSEKYVKLSAINNVITNIIAVIFILFIFKQNYFGKVYAHLITVSIISTFLMLKNRKIIKSDINKKHIKYLLLFGVPLIGHSLSGFILSQSDRIVIARTIGANDAGLYSLAYNIGMIINVIIAAVNMGWTPVFYKLMKNNENQKIQIQSYKNQKIIVSISFLLILFSADIGKVMSGKQYYDAFRLIPVIIVSYVAFFLYSQYAIYAFYRKKTAIISIFTLMAGGINIFLNFKFVPIYGYYVAAWTTFLSYLILMMLHYINIKFVLKEKNIIKINKKDILLLIVFCIIINKLVIYNIILYITLKLLIALVFLILIFYKKIKVYLKK